MKEPLFLLDRQDQYYQITVLDTDPQEIKDFYAYHFEQRDSRLGKPVLYERTRKTSKGIQYQASLREIGETFLDKYGVERYVNHLRNHSLETPKKEQILEDITSIPKIYDYMFAIESSGHYGRYNFWQVYAPGFSNEELQKNIPNKYFSQSEKQYKEQPPGFSPLLKKGDAFNFKTLLDKVIKQTYVSEQDYFLMKRTGEEDKQFVDHLERVDNKDKVAFHFFRKWPKPILFFDNTSDWDSGPLDGMKMVVTYKGGKKETIIIDEYKLQEEDVFEMYPVLQEQEDYPLPDNEFFNQGKRQHPVRTSPKAKKRLAEIIEEAKAKRAC